MSILDRIVAHKKGEVAKLQASIPQIHLEQALSLAPQSLSLREFLQRPDKNGVIAEFKRQSPSAGAINRQADVAKVARGYMAAGCAGISVLTDAHFFGGRAQDLKQVAAFADVPLLRKDFIIAPYQITEARTLGASVILLIASILTKEEMATFTAQAHDLGMEVLVEIHTRDEIGKIPKESDLVGINNRNLNNFKVELSHSVALRQALPSDFPVIAESGISTSQDIAYLRQHGFAGFLVGSALMKQNDPARALADLVKETEE